MESACSASLSVSYLSWINEELRKKAEQHQEETEQAKISTRLKAALSSGLSAVSFFLLSLSL